MQTSFFDVPVYRLAEDRYNAELDAYIERTMYPSGKPWSEETRGLHKRLPHLRIAFEDHLWRSFGGMWRYNEIVGYIRLHFLGSQLRGEYASTIKKRAVRTRTRTFLHRDYKFATELSIPVGSTGDEIFNLVKQYLLECKRKLPKRHVDMTMFDAVGPYVDWKRLYSDHLQQLNQRATT